MDCYQREIAKTEAYLAKLESMPESRVNSPAMRDGLRGQIAYYQEKSRLLTIELAAIEDEVKAGTRVKVGCYTVLFDPVTSGWTVINWKGKVEGHFATKEQAIEIARCLDRELEEEEDDRLRRLCSEDEDENEDEDFDDDDDDDDE